jgi:hypothetical protein
MEKELAQQVAYLLRGCEGTLVHTLWLVKRHGTEEEFLKHRRALGHVLAELGMQILYPIYAQYPELDPTRPTSSGEHETQSSEKPLQGEEPPDPPDPDDQKS